MYLKKTWLFSVSLLLLCMTSATGYAQTLKDFFSDESTPLTYLGVDFSSAKVQGEVATATEIRDKFEPINSVIVNEAKKYDVADAFSRGSVTSDLSAVNKVNAATNTDKIKTDNTADMQQAGLKPEDISRKVKAYDLKGKKGIGLVFIMDGMSKADKEASMYVTLLDMATGKVLLTERMTGKAQGFGFRNYWAYTVYKVIKEIDNSKYKDWKKKG